MSHVRFLFHGRGYTPVRYERPRRIQTRHSTRYRATLHDSHRTGYQAEYYALRQARGLCPRCPATWDGPGVCPSCRKKLSLWRQTSTGYHPWKRPVGYTAAASARSFARRKAAGQCLRCRRKVKRFLECAFHRAQRCEWERQRRQRAAQAERRAA